MPLPNPPMSPYFHPNALQFLSRLAPQSDITCILGYWRFSNSRWLTFSIERSIKYAKFFSSDHFINLALCLYKIQLEVVDKFVKCCHNSELTQEDKS